MLDQRRIDLHTHSTFSDGTMTPHALLKKAHLLGLHGLSITDHDSTTSFLEGYTVAKEYGLILIPGIEMSTEFQNESIHVLGYAHNPYSDVLQAACRLHQMRREERNKEMIERLQKKGVQITYDEVLSQFPEVETYGRPHIAQILVQKGYATTIQEVFKKYLGSGKPCYVPGKRWTTLEAIELIKKASGFAILAHPHLVLRYQRVQELMRLPFDGLEGYYANFSLDDSKRYIKLAEAKNILITGGSDFHGSVKPQNILGSSIAPSKTIDIFIERTQQHLAL